MPTRKTSNSCQQYIFLSFHLSNCPQSHTLYSCSGVPSFTTILCMASWLGISLSHALGSYFNVRMLHKSLYITGQNWPWFISKHGLGTICQCRNIHLFVAIYTSYIVILKVRELGICSLNKYILFFMFCFDCRNSIFEPIVIKQMC